MNGLTKANTILKNELTNKITDVLHSFAYDEVAGDVKTALCDCLMPVRYYTKGTFLLTVVIEGEKNLLADAEMAAIAINAMLGMEIEHPDIRLNHGKLNLDVKGEVSVLDDVEEDSDELDDLYALADILDGYDLASFVSVDLTAPTESDGLAFSGFAGDTKILSCERKGSNVTLVIDLLSAVQFKLGNKELKDPVPVALVASDMADNAYKVAFGLRQQGLKAEGYISGGSMYAAEEYCDLKGIPTLLWVTETKVIMKNIQSGETAETTLEKLLGK